MIYGITLILLGCLAIPSLIIAKRPDAKAAFDKLSPYQGWIGLIGAIWGIFVLVQCIRFIATLTVSPVVWVLWLCSGVLLAALGFALSYGVTSKFLLSKNKNAAEKADGVMKKLLPFQGRLGIIAIVLGVVQIIASFIFTVA